MRLQKYMAEAGVASRRACEKLIAEGRVLVNGTAAQIGQSVEANDLVQLDGVRIGAKQRTRVLAFYKPRGVVCTSDDPEGRRTVQDYLKEIPERLYNVGRLDLNSEGLLLLTNDGELAYQLTHPRFGVKKTYYVVCEGRVNAAEAARLTNGVELEDGMTAPARVDWIRPMDEDKCSLSITIHEGRNRQVRRMLEAVGHRTLRLKRERFGALTLGQLRPGQWRELSREEIDRLKASIDS